MAGNDFEFRHLPKDFVHTEYVAVAQLQGDRNAILKTNILITNG